jgi:hypothetical protein
MGFTTAAAALKILETAWKTLGAVRERAQASKDNALKESVGNLLDDFNSLRFAVARLTEENDELRKAQVEKPPRPDIREVGRTNYYFAGEDGPYCQPCFDVKGKLIPLSPRQRYGSGFGKKCEVCKNLFIEADAPPMKIQARPYWDQ